MEEVEGFQNYLRLTLLLNHGCETLQKVFQVQYKKITGKEWKNGPESGDEFVNGLGNKYFKSAQPIQKKLLEGGDLNSWDITLLSSLIPSMLESSSKSSSSGAAGPEIKSIKMKIQDLKKVRNEISHIGDIRKSVSNAEFPKMWKQAASAVLSLGGDAQAMENLRSAANISGMEFKGSGSISQENTIKARKLKEEGNSALTGGDYEKAITIYSEALNLFGLGDVEKGVLHSNRSHAYLKSLNKTKCTKKIHEYADLALDDAKMTIKLRPNWWKGYSRAGHVYKFKKEWDSAIVLFDQALVLKPSDEDEVKKVRDECRYNKRQDTIQEHLDPCNRPGSRAEGLSKISRNKESKGMTGQTREKIITKMNEEFLKSEDSWKVGFASIYFAHHHLHGVDMPVNYSMAATLFAKGAAAGIAEGIYNMGLLYLNGKGVPQDFHRAIGFFEEAAELPLTQKLHGVVEVPNVGVAEAQYMIGKCYDDGVGKPKDSSMAVKWYKRASDNKCHYASNNLAILYSNGKGVKRDEVKAVQYWKLAVDRGNVLAMESLAWHYLRKGDFKQAQTWYDRSVEAGNMNSIIGKKDFMQAMEQMKNNNSANVNFEELIKRVQALSAATGFEGHGKLPMNKEFCEALFQNSLPQTLKTKQQNKNKNEDEKQEGDKENAPTSIVQLTNPKRIEVVLSHRESLKSVVDKKKENKLFKPNTATPFLEQKAPVKLSSLKEITLSAMHPTKDHVYSGTVITLTICEDSLMNFYTSIHTVVRDDNWDVQRAYFYNIKQEDKKKFTYGAEISVMNPYFRLTSDMGTAIRVDDPRSIVFHSTPTPESKTMCRFCGKLDAKSRCGICKRVYYCDKDCQSKDWKKLKHKLICDSELEKFL